MSNPDVAGAIKRVEKWLAHWDDISGRTTWTVGGVAADDIRQICAIARRARDVDAIRREVNKTGIWTDKFVAKRVSTFILNGDDHGGE